jgi:menaquinone-dependent protoporphyrinogen oxidase
MPSFLVVYGTGEGQTAKVAGRIGRTLTDRGHDTVVIDVADRTPDRSLDTFDAILVGASIHAGKPQSAVVKFVTANRETLAAKPTAFFQVSLSTATEQGAKRAAGYVEQFIEKTGWHPDRIGLFGGALRYSEYGFLKCLLMKQIAKRTYPDLDTAEDVEFTDLAEVDAFTADVAAFVEGRLGTPPPSKTS